MRKLIYKLLLLFKDKDVKTKPKNAKAPMNAKLFYNFKIAGIDGKEIDFNIYKGKKVLVVNTASECGFTPQYDDLQQLHEKHGNKVTVLGFPANNFGGQEPGSDAEIGAFCRKNFGVTFQLFQKSDVIGENQNELFKWLSDKDQNGWNTEQPNWNFCKYLISENGDLLKFYSSAISPMSEEVLKML